MLTLLYKIGLPVIALGLLIGAIHHYVGLTYKIQQANQQIAQLQSDKDNQAKQINALTITNQSLQEDSQHAQQDIINAHNNIASLNNRLLKYTHNNACVPSITHNSNTKHITPRNTPNAITKLVEYINVLYKAGDSCRNYYNRLYSACDKYSDIVRVINR
jgi:hypothetical protein